MPHLRETYNTAAAWLKMWPFPMVTATRREYIALSAIFPGWLMPLSHLYDLGIPNVYTLFRRLERHGTKVVRKDGVNPYSIYEIVGCILRTRHDGEPCPAVTAIAVSPLLEQLLEWIDGPAGEPAPGGAEPACTICGWHSHGKDFAHVAAGNVITVNLQTAAIINELSAIMRMPFYRFIRSAIAYAAKHGIDGLSDAASLIITHTHYTDFFSYPSDQYWDALTDQQAARFGMHPWDFLRTALLRYADACLDLVDTRKITYTVGVSTSSSEGLHANRPSS